MPVTTETCIWYELFGGMDLTEQAILCKYISILNQKEFEKIQDKIMPDPNITKSDLTSPFVEQMR